MEKDPLKITKELYSELVIENETKSSSGGLTLGVYWAK